LSAVLSTSTHSYPVTVENISREGARVRGIDVPGEGIPITLKIENIDTFGTVAWSRAGRCGIAFESFMTAAEFERLRHEAILASRSGLEPDARAALTEWQLGSR
jgi:hypothetical protein